MVVPTLTLVKFPERRPRAPPEHSRAPGREHTRRQIPTRNARTGRLKRGAKVGTLAPTLHRPDRRNSARVKAPRTTLDQPPPEGADASSERSNCPKRMKTRHGTVPGHSTRKTRAAAHAGPLAIAEFPTSGSSLIQNRVPSRTLQKKSPARPRLYCNPGTNDTHPTPSHATGTPTASTTGQEVAPGGGMAGGGGGGGEGNAQDPPPLHNSPFSRLPN